MFKKQIFGLVIMAFVLSSSFIGNLAQASSSHSGKLVRMEGLSSVYYVGADEKRYVFPNANTYNSWFSDFDDVVTLSRDELTSISLGGNVRYRPGALLVKITTDPKVYAVAKNGTLRWLKTEKVVKNIYGNNWSKLVDDLPDAFFTNYTVGDPISTVSDFDADDEANGVDSIDTNHGFSNERALRAHTGKCQMVNGKRKCKSGNGNWGNAYGNDNEDDNEDEDDESSLYIKNVIATNRGENGYIDNDDEITITFSEEINPESISSKLKTGGFYSILGIGNTGSITVSSSGILTIEDIASFDIGSVEDEGQFATKAKLNSSGRILTISIVGGDAIKIEDEDFDDVKQIGGTVEDENGNAMEDETDVCEADGSFGGEDVNNDTEPYITKIEAFNKGLNDYIDVDDEIEITFSEEIEAETIHALLEAGDDVSGVESDETGGVSVDEDGILTIEDIASFYVGDIDTASEFEVELALDDEGEVLTIILTHGVSIELTNEDLDDAEQIGGTIEDKDENEMDDDPSIDDPEGSFTDNGDEDNIHITKIKAYDTGFAGYVDVNDKIVITFSEEIEPGSIDSSLDEGDKITGIESDETGGVYIDDDGILTVTDILSFDIGEVDEEGEFEVELSLDDTGRVLTIILTDGNSIKIIDEDFSDAEQFKGYVEDKDENSMNAAEDLDIVSGTFGGDSSDASLAIAEIIIENGGRSGYIDEQDEIIVVFNRPIDPESIHDDLEEGDDVDDVDDDDTGGVEVEDDGILTISDIAEFYVGEVDDDGSFDVRLSLNDTGNVLIITLTSGSSIKIIDADLDDASQDGGTVEDDDGNEMEADPRISDPEGEF